MIDIMLDIKLDIKSDILYSIIKFYTIPECKIQFLVSHSPRSNLILHY